MYPNLRVELWRAKLRQNKLAKMFEMDETLLSRILNGYREPSPEFRKKISELLETDEAWLFQVESREIPKRTSAKAAGERW